MNHAGVKSSIEGIGDLPDSLNRLDIHITLDQPQLPPPPPLDGRIHGHEVFTPHPLGIASRPCPATQQPHGPPPPAAAAASSSSRDPTRWMATLPSGLPLSALSIPGTHDSCAASSLPYVRTQYLSVTAQLELGSRALDLRLRRRGAADGPDTGLLFCYHGGVPLLGPDLRPLAFARVMDEVWAFLDRPGPGGGGGGGEEEEEEKGRSRRRRRTRRTETVLVCVDNDNVRDSRDPAGQAAFYRAVAAAVASTPPWPDPDDPDAPPPDDGRPAARWFAESRTPTLGEVRGRAVLLRRFAPPPPPPPPPAAGSSSLLRDGSAAVVVEEERPRDRCPVDAAAAAVAEPPSPPPPPSLGLDLSAWVNDSADFTIVTPGGRFRVQDKWLYADPVTLGMLVDSKSVFVRRMIEAALTSGPPLKSPEEGEEGGAGGKDRSREEQWFINFCSAVGDPLRRGSRAELADAKAVAVGGYTGWGGTWVDGVNVVIGEYLVEKQKERERKKQKQREREQDGRRSCEGTTTQPSRQRLGVVYMDFPELPDGNDLVARVIETNFW